MSWRLEYSEAARKQLRKMDAAQRGLLLTWLDKHIDGCDDPRAQGKALVGQLAGAWRYRVGNYRVLCELYDDRAVVLAIKVGHRRDVYC